MVGDEADVFAFGGEDEFVGEEGHVFGFEKALVILVVGAFVEGEFAGLLGCDGFAGDRMEDLKALRIGVGTADFAQGDLRVGGQAVEHVVASVGCAGDAAEVIGIGREDRFSGFPDGGGVFVEGEFVEDEVAGESAGGAGGWRAIL